MNTKTQASQPRQFDNIDQWDIETDIAVMGFGGAGASAAIEAHDAGAEVMIFELASAPGGSTALSGADIYLGGGTPVQKACGYDDTQESMFEYMMASSGAQADEEKIRNYVEHSVEHYSWLTGCGVPFKMSEHKERAVMPLNDDCLLYSGNEKAYPFNQQSKPFPRGHNPEVFGDKGGALVMDAMAKNVHERGVRVEYEARVLTLIIDADGEVKGFVVRINQQEYNVRVRKGLILCAGGFVMNDVMLKKYAPDLLRCNYKTGNPGDTGSGILMGMGVGGAAINMHEGFVSIAFYQPASLTNGIFINSMGQRFINEDCYHGRVGSYALRQPGERIYLVLNVEDYGDYEQMNYIFAPVAGTGEDISELEKELELTSGTLKNTIGLYNEYASKGEDPVFHKSAEWLKRIEPPYVALDCTPGRGAIYSVFTLGGLDTKPTGEVLTTEGAVIKGLYAAGRTACGISRRGDGYSSGMSVGDATFSGRMAGKAAATRN
jgi:succinate dehydrogenase/fumarate reductase flavoprotein subunit